PALRIDVRAGLGRNRDPDTLPWRAEAKPWARHDLGCRPRGDHLAGGIRAELQVELCRGRGSGNARPPPEGGGARASREHHPTEADSTQDVSAREVLGSALHSAVVAPAWVISARSLASEPTIVCPLSAWSRDRACRRRSVICGRCAQRFEQRLRLYEIARDEALGEARAGGRERITPRGATALIVEQARQAHGRPQLEGARALRAGDGERAPVAGGDLVACPTGGEKQLAIQAMELRVPERLARPRRDREAGRHGPLRRDELTRRMLHLGEEPEERRGTDLTSRLTCQREPAGDLVQRAEIARGQARCGVPRPPEAEPQGEALRLAQRDHLLRPLGLPCVISPCPVDG